MKKTLLLFLLAPSFAWGQDDPRPVFTPTCPVVYKVTIARDPKCTDVIAIHWSHKKPSEPTYSFRDIRTGRTIHPPLGAFVAADWWDVNTAEKSNYGENLDALDVKLTPAEESAIAKIKPAPRRPSQLPPPKTQPRKPAAGAYRPGMWGSGKTNY